MITTREITVTLHDFNGEPLDRARVAIFHRFLGNGPDGAVSPGAIEALTNSAGVAVFSLWQNDTINSDSYYEISSWHPVSGTPIHRREYFVVGDSDANVRSLINVAPASIDPNQALLGQVSIDRAAAEQARLDCQAILVQAQAIYDAISSGGSALTISDQSIAVIEGVSQIVRLGPDVKFSGEQITYSVDSQDIVINGNMATFSSSVVGQQLLIINAIDSGGASDTAQLTVNVVSQSSVTEYTLPGVQVA